MSRTEIKSETAEPPETNSVAQKMLDLQDLKTFRQIRAKAHKIFKQANSPHSEFTKGKKYFLGFYGSKPDNLTEPIEDEKSHSKHHGSLSFDQKHTNSVTAEVKGKEIMESYLNQRISKKRICMAMKHKQKSPLPLYNLRDRMTNFKDILYSPSGPYDDQERVQSVRYPNYHQLKEKIQETDSRRKYARIGYLQEQNDIGRKNLDFQVPFFQEEMNKHKLSTFLDLDEESTQNVGKDEKKGYNSVQHKSYDNTQKSSALDIIKEEEAKKMYEMGLISNLERHCTPKAKSMVVKSYELGIEMTPKFQVHKKDHVTSVNSSYFSPQNTSQVQLPNLRQLCKEKGIAFSETERLKFEAKKTIKNHKMLKDILNGVVINDGDEADSFTLKVIEHVEDFDPKKGICELFKEEKGKFYRKYIGKEKRQKEKGTKLPFIRGVDRFTVRKPSIGGGGQVSKSFLGPELPQNIPQQRYKSVSPQRQPQAKFKYSSVSIQKENIRKMQQIRKPSEVQIIPEIEDLSQLPEKAGEEKSGILGAAQTALLEQNRKKLREKQAFKNRFYKSLEKINPLHGLRKTNNSLMRKREEMEQKLGQQLERHDLDYETQIKEKRRILMKAGKSFDSSGLYTDIKKQQYKKFKENEVQGIVYNDMLTYIVDRKNIEPLPIEEQFLNVFKVIVQGNWLLGEKDFYEVLNFIQAYLKINNQFYHFLNTFRLKMGYGNYLFKEYMHNIPFYAGD